MSLILNRNFNLEFNSSWSWKKKKERVQNSLPSFLKVLEIDSDKALIMDKRSEEIDYYSLLTMECLSDIDKPGLCLHFEVGDLIYPGTIIATPLRYIQEYIRNSIRNLGLEFLVLCTKSKYSCFSKVGYLDAATKFDYFMGADSRSISVTNAVIKSETIDNWYVRGSLCLYTERFCTNTNSLDKEYFLLKPDEKDLENYYTFQNSPLCR